MTRHEKRIGIRELKATLSECVREVKAGRTIVVTEHGRPVARIIPEAISFRERVEALRKAGTIAWSGRRLRPAKPAGDVDRRIRETATAIEPEANSLAG